MYQKYIYPQDTAVNKYQHCIRCPLLPTSEICLWDSVVYLASRFSLALENPKVAQQFHRPLYRITCDQ